MINKNIFASDHAAPDIVSKVVVGKTLADLGAIYENLIVCDADLMLPAGTVAFKNAYPQRHFNFGIAEQNMVCAAAGLALEGKTVFASTFANFASKRACDQMSICVAYNKANVKLCGIYAGLTCEKNGGTHISVEDVAIMRSIPGITVIEPGDLEELRQAVIAAAEFDGPVYLRIPKMYKAQIFSENYQFRIGKAVELTGGGDIAICACGLTSGIAFHAALQLKEQGVNAKVIHFGTLKPIDEDAVLEAAKTGAVLTVENHSVIGGLGSAVMEVLSRHRLNPAVRRLGLQDVFGMTADLDWQLEYNGLSQNQVAQSACELIAKK